MATPTQAVHEIPMRRRPKGDDVPMPSSVPEQPVQRRYAASLFILGTGFLFAFVFLLAVARAETWAQTKELLAVVLPIVMFALGGVLGFGAGRGRR